MNFIRKDERQSLIFMLFTLLFGVLIIVAAVYLSVFHSANNIGNFTSEAVPASDEWTITDSAGISRGISLPVTIPYGTDGMYTLSGILNSGTRQEGYGTDQGQSETLMIYSNYIDFEVFINGTGIYRYPEHEAMFSGATGNTNHFITLPNNYQGSLLEIKIHGQLGDDIGYLLDTPVICVKASMLYRSITESMPAIALSCFLLLLSVGLALLYIVFGKILGLNNATMQTALFAAVFAVYVFCETSFARYCTVNGYMLCFVTLILLALLPIPMIGIFSETMSRKFSHVPGILTILCSCNIIGQLILNFNNIYSVRVMLPATHAIMIITIASMACCLWFSDVKEYPSARKNLLSAVPMLIGGITDITLLMINLPSLNNSMWFTIGVSMFIAIQFISFINSYFKLYRSTLETSLLRDMAYMDSLTGIANRNAYERKLKELSADEPPKGLCCMVLDINDLKKINDIYGHQAGDAAIVGIGKILTDCLPDNGFCYRTGGDEFIVIIDNYDITRTRALAEKLTGQAAGLGSANSVPLSIAIGCGQYESQDGNVIDFIRRVDSIMYAKKYELKKSGDYPFGKKNT